MNSLTEDQVIDRDDDGDVDVNGHLAMGLFVGVLLVIVMVIYALANAA